MVASDVATHATSRLHGKRVLVVEDETLIYLLLEDMLRELGCGDVQHASGVAEALAMLDHGAVPDVAVLDVNLAGEQAFPVARQLRAAGVPFLFATGYGRHGLPSEWSPKPIIQKPFRLETLASALETALAGPPDQR